MTNDLSIDDIDAADDARPVPMDVPEWGGRVYVRALTGTDRDSYEASMTIRRGDQVLPNPIGTRSRLVVRGLCNAAGERLYQDSDADKVGKKSSTVLDRLWDKIAELSGMTAGAVEDAEGNSETVPSESSTSD